ncbi:hypothetical protein RD110_06970 [Rhodoferax koreense]|uniref:Toxin CptA n=1 Tax=Rhodoferax koreensis TaxID=1842727 RepID=A0A1P8JTD1_9BURK|nr:hypothetical protein [Rhodoferax koreense]APW36971.1 hypothetical protein RD110_06970 [Rhodoferax koreense]
MHNAPSVSYPVGRSLFFGRLLLAIWLFAAALAAWWCLGAAAMGWRQWLVLACLPLAGGAAWSSWRAMVPGELRWDGQVWLWNPGEQAEPARLELHLDLQDRLLLCLHLDSGHRLWCWLEWTNMPERWGDLRRAVYSRAESRAVSDDAQPNAVKPAAPASPET